MSTEAAQAPTGRAARVTTLSLEAFTAAGAVAGVYGFLDGAFDSLVAEVHDAWSLVDGRLLPALALGATVAAPQVAALVLGLRRHRWAPEAGQVVGAALVAWVTLQLPLIGWGSPVQWVFVGIGVAEVVAATAWRRRSRRAVSAAPAAVAA